MLCTRMIRGLFGAAAVAAWLAGAASAQNYHVVGYDDGGSPEATALKSEVSELREQLGNTTQVGYEASCGCSAQVAPGCGCSAQMAPTCGCTAHVGCAGGCGGGYDMGCGCDMGCDCGCCEPCCHSSGLYAIGELMYFRYHRADGVRVGDAADEVAEFDFESTVRATVGYVRDDGLGVRLRWWEFDHNAAAQENRSVFQVDTYNIDLETFDTFCLNRNWDLELSGGVRYNHFIEQMVDSTFPFNAANQVRTNLFHGYGGLIGVEARRAVGCTGVLWARGRASILMDDKFVRNVDDPNPSVRLTDTVAGQVELAFGYDYVMPLCDGSYYFVRASAEWQQWSNFSSSFDTINDEDEFDAPSDVGFGGFGFAVGLVR